MTGRLHLGAIGFLLSALLMTATGTRAETVATSPKALERAIRDFITKYPQVIREALEKAELDEQLANTKQVLKSQRDKIYGAGSPVLGKPDAKITIVEFYDYNCPYCRTVHGKLKDILKRHPDTRIVLKDIATFGADSEAVGRIVLAAGRQGKLPDLHEALMAFKGKATEATAIDFARRLDLDIDKLKKDAALPEIAKQMKDAQALANELGVNGTPLFLIGHNGIPGAPDDLTEQIEKFLADIRENGCEVC